MGSTGGKHCKSLKRNVRRRVVLSLKKQCLWTQNAAFHSELHANAEDSEDFLASRILRIIN